MTPSLNIPVGSSYTCRPLFLDQFNRPMQPAPASPTFASDTPSVATVDAASGVVTAVSAGTAIITATSGSMSASVTVKPYTPTAAKLSM